nr:MAG TPA: leucine rich repeat protein [Caudoviricetes sp.]
MDEKEKVIGNILRGQINVGCTLIGELAQGTVVVIPSADLNKFLEQITADVYSKKEVDEKLKKLSDNANSEADKLLSWLKERNYNLKNFKGLEKTFPKRTFIAPDFNQPKVGESVIHGTGSPNTIIEFDGKKYEVDDNGDWTITSDKPFEKGTVYKLNYYDYADRLNTLKFDTERGLYLNYSIPFEDNITVLTKDIVKKYDLKGDVILPITVVEISNDSFAQNSYIVSIKARSVKKVGGSAFYNCLKLTSISLPNVISIGDEAFANCSNLTSISLPNVTSIGGRAFDNCSNLTSISLLNVTSIGNAPFNYCEKLNTLIVNDKTDTGVLVHMDINDTCIIYNQDKTKKFNRETEQWENV